MKNTEIAFKNALKEMLEGGEFDRLAKFNEFDEERIRKLEAGLRSMEEDGFSTSLGEGIDGLPFIVLIAAFSDAEPVLADVLCFMAAADMRGAA